MLNQGKFMLKIRTIIAFFITFLLCSLIGFITVQNRIAAYKEQIERLIVEHSYRINEVLSQQLYKTQALAAFVIKGDGTVEDFQKIASVLATDIPMLANFLLAPDGVVTDVYPLEGNESVIGLDFFNEAGHAGNKEAILARDTGELVMAGPFTLRQGITGLTGRYPVYIDSGTEERVFWGLVSVSLKFPEALEDVGLNMLEYQGLSYELWRINPDTNERQVIATNNANPDADKEYIERQINIHHAEWNFRIFPIPVWYEYLETWLLVLGALSISLFVAFVMQARYTAVQRASRFNEATQAKSKLLALVSHEIRTPMNVIIGISEIELGNAAHRPDVRDAFDKINCSSRMLLGIINDLLDMSKVETGKLELIPVDYDVPGLIYDTARLNMMLIGDKPVEFAVKAAETLPSVLNGDDRRIKQILNNVLSNAIKYTNEGNVTLAVDSDVGENCVTIIFTVKDTGQGLTKEQLLTLYDEYSMFNQKANRKTAGTGLGMNITKKFVEMLGGRIEAESEPGVGSTFTIYIPQIPADLTPIGKELADSLNSFEYSSRSSQIKPGMLLSSGKVLIVDDVAENLFVAEGLIKLYGLKTDTAESGHEAIEKVRAGNIYDIIFMDYMMPEMDGIEAVKIIREGGYKHPVVALTANAVTGMKELCLENGFDDFIPKPFDLTELENIIGKFIAGKKSPAATLISELKDICNLDTGSAVEAFGGMEDFYIDTVKITARIMPDRIDRICTLMDNDIEAFAVEVHGFKSVLRNIGANALSIACSQLERAALENDTAYLNDNFTAFHSGLVELSYNLDKVLQPESADVKETADKSLLNEIIADLKTAVENYDGLLALELLSAYIDFSYDPETDELLKKILFSLEISNYESTLTSIEAMEEKLNG